jgi:RHS repeat-associated protein
MLLLLLGPGRGRVHIGVSVSPARATAVAIAVLGASVPVLMGPQCGGGGPPPVRHFHVDHLGSLQAVSDGGGALIGQSRYRPYGTARRYDGAGTSAPADEKARHEFIGYETEIDTGLDYAYARFYDPDLGQFMSHDPAAALPSPYAYGPGDPINSVDPTGEEPFSIAIGIIIAVLWVVKTSYNYARSGDWEFALQEGVQTPVPTEGPVIGPIQQAGVVRVAAGDQSGGASGPGRSVDTIDSTQAVLALRAAMSLAQGGTTDAPYCKDPDYCQEGKSTGRAPRSPDLVDLVEIYGLFRAAGALVRGAISAIGRVAARRGAQAAERVGTQAAERYSAETLAKVERQLKEHGRRSLERSRRSLQKNIETQRQDIERYREAGGYTSSVEREIRAFESELRAIEDVLGR